MRDIENMLEELAEGAEASFDMDDVRTRGATLRSRFVRRVAVVGVAGLAIIGIGVSAVIDSGPYQELEVVQPADAPLDPGVSAGDEAGSPTPTPSSAPSVTAAAPTPVTASSGGDFDAPTALPVSEPTPTPIVSPTATPSSTPGATPEPSATATTVPSATVTPLPSATPQPSPSPTSTPISTPTATSTLAPTPTATASPTPTATPPATSTPTSTPSPVPTATPTQTVEAAPQPLPPCGADATVLAGRPLQSGQYGPSNPASNAFDGVFGPAWLSELWVAPAFLGLAVDGPARTVTAYQIVYANGPALFTRAPNTWQFQGSANGVTWATLDSRSGETGWFEDHTRRYTVEAPGSYSQYRLLVTDDNDDRDVIVVVSIAELTLFHSCQP